LTMKIAASTLNTLLQTHTIVSERELNILDISIDSRSLRNTPHTLFFALKGAHHNAHEYVPELYEKGVRYFVVSDVVDLPADALIFKVTDTLQAFQQFVAFYRKKYHF